MTHDRDRDPLAEARQPERVDLDALEARWRQLKVKSDLTVTGPVYAITVRLPALIAELRAGRKVVETVRPWPPLVCVDCYETACDGDGDDEPCGCEDGCHAKDQAFRDALAAYDQATGAAP